MPLKLQPAAKELKWLQWSQCNGLAIEYKGLLLQTTTGKIVPVPGSAPPGWTVAGQAVSDCTYTQIGKPLRRQTQRCTPGMQHKAVLLVFCMYFDHIGGNIVMNQNELNILKSRHKIFDNSTLCTFVKFGYFRHFETY